MSTAVSANTLVVSTAVELIRMLGGGGMSSIWLVKDLATGRPCVMKTFSDELDRGFRAEERFDVENRVLAALSHPHIVRLYGVFTTAGHRLVMLMEHIEGMTLSDYSIQLLSSARCLDIVLQLLSALAHAHNQGIIHRDVKPANIMITPSGDVKLIDFGISKSFSETKRLTVPGAFMGSLSYMSPEQIQGYPVERTWDLYAVGVILFELVTRQRPFNGATDFTLMHSIITDDPPSPEDINPTIPPVITRIILKAISKQAAHRFQSAEEFIAAIKLAIDQMHAETAAAAAIKNQKWIRITATGWIRTVCAWCFA